MIYQEVFDKVVAHFAIQRVPAIENNSCKYRTSTGLKCAFGALIPDEAYDPRFEGKTVKTLIKLYGKRLGFEELTPEDVKFFDDIQRAHDFVLADGASFLKGFSHKMFRLAEFYGLNPSSLEALK